MGAIWDRKTKTHTIKTTGIIVGQVKSIHDIQNLSLSTNADIEYSIQETINLQGIKYGKHIRIHIYDKFSGEYVLWIGHTSIELPDNWWNEINEVK